MKILSVGNFSTGWDGSQCDEEHIAKALEGLGHEVVRQQRETWREDLELKGGFDFVLIAQWDGYDYNQYGARIATAMKDRTSGPVVYWAFDYQADGQEWHERLVKESDLYLSKRITDSKYPNWQYLSQDFAPNFLKPYAGVTKDIDVLFTGSYLDWAKERNETIRAVNDNFNLVIHSVNAWPSEWGLDVRPPIMDEGLPELYARAKVILSIDHTLETGYHSDRNAQIICCGERPLFRYVPMSEATFHNDVDYFYSVEDCLKKIQEQLDGITYLNDKPDTEKYKVNARVRDLLVIVENYLENRSL